MLAAVCPVAGFSCVSPSPLGIRISPFTKKGQRSTSVKMAEEDISGLLERADSTLGTSTDVDHGPAHRHECAGAAWRKHWKRLRPNQSKECGLCEGGDG